MHWRNTSEGYGAVFVTLHWLTVALVIVAWLFGEFGDVLPKGAARAAGLMVHISAGLALLSAVLCRLLWRLADPPPPPAPDEAGSAWLDRMARLAHVLLYLLLVAAPVLGIVLQFARGDALPLFGFGEIASPWPADRAFARAVKGRHELAANALVILAALHAAAAIGHHVLLRDRTLVRMLPAAWRS